MDKLTIGLAWGTIHQANLPQTIEAAARHGFPTIQVPPDLYFESREAGVGEKQMRRWLADAGVKVRVLDGISGGLPGLPKTPVMFKGRAMPRFEALQCVEAAEALEAPMINITHYMGEPPKSEVLAEAVGTACRIAARGNIDMVLEFVPDSGIPNLGAACAIIETCGEPNVGVHLDTWHLARSGGTAADIDALPRGRILAFQLSDRKAPPPDTPYVHATGRLLPGEGELPLREIVAAARANNSALTLEVEIFNDAINSLPPDVAAGRVAAAVQAWRAHP